MEWLPVTLIIAAYNEGSILEKKVKNTLDIDYPPEKLKVIFVTDGSTDGSETIIGKYPSFLLLHQPERRGKLAAIKRAIGQVRTPIVVFSDANAMLNRECIQKIVRHYNNPATGGVAGEKKITGSKQQSAVGMAEGLYWNYESFMKKQDAAFNTVVGAAGELFSIRTDLFPELGENIILDDFVISMKVCIRGYKIDYEPQAFATEWPSLSLGEEGKRKVRISAGAYQSIAYLKSALNVFKHPLLSFQYISRRLLRWIFCPLMLVILLTANILIVFTIASPAFYTFFLYGQLSFYMMALLGWLITSTGKKAGVLTIPFYFVFMNYCLAKGFIQFLNGKQTVLWEKSIRQATE
ncbi:MAG: glycosyltransferase family 2 protein [Bacteroidota bacterium]|nr:glycosyltransferase family 2 protein [Bacteroidota bacterium]